MYIFIHSFEKFSKTFVYISYVKESQKIALDILYNLLCNYTKVKTHKKLNKYNKKEHFFQVTGSKQNF